jgi:hypothetical protein
MSKKLFLAPLLATVVFVLVPAAAQANPHYYINGTKLAAGKTKQVIEWGTITLTTNAKPVGNSLTCHNAAGGVVNGTAEGVNGTGATELFAAYKCEQKKMCPAETDVASIVAKKLPWASELVEEEEGVARSKSKGVEMVVVCLNTKGEQDDPFAFVTNQKAGSKCEALGPTVKTGSSASHPGFLEFAEGSKELEIPLTEETCELVGKTEGEVKQVGYSEQELVNVKSP